MRSKVVPDRSTALTLGYIDIPGFTNLYMVKPGTKNSLSGSVLFLGRWAICGNNGGMRYYPPKFLTQNIHPISGHPFVNIANIKGKNFHWQVGRIVLMATLGRKLKKGMETCHNNGNPIDNRQKNLREDTKSGNVADSFRHGTAFVPPPRDQRGIKNNAAKFTDSDIIDIRIGFASGKYKVTDLISIYNVSSQCLYNIINRKTWKTVKFIDPTRVNLKPILNNIERKSKECIHDK